MFGDVVDMFENDWRIIKKIAKLLECNSINYHFDASTAVFVHGIEFEMDDIDIVFIANEENIVRDAFEPYKPGATKIVNNTFKYFWVTVDGKPIHCLFYGEDGEVISKDKFNRNADCLCVDGQIIVAQSLQFYLKYSKKNEALKPQIERWLLERNLGMEPYFPMDN